MSNGALSIPITADASKFLKTLADVKDEIKGLKKELDTATGTRVAAINLEITGLEQQKNAFKEFGAFAEGTYGRLLQQLDYLNAYALTLKVDSAELKNTFTEISNVKDQIKAIQGKDIKINAEVVQPPAGSINDIKQQIEQLSKSAGILVGVELTQANIKIKELKEELKRLQNQGIELEVDPIPPILENSIEGLEAKLKKLRNAVIKIDVDNKGEIAALNNEISQLESEISKAKNLSIDPNGKISQSSNKARQAITSLTLVAQDLPFGFIAIQNNLPAVGETFNRLVSDSGGLKNGLKQLGGALVGPAGLFFAFSAITSAITFAVKEYGSINAAIRALTGNATELDGVIMRAQKSLEAYNKELSTTSEITAAASGESAGEVERIKSLAAAVRDVTLSETQRANALKELKEIDPKNLENIQNTVQGYKDLDEWVKKYTDSLIANAIAKKYVDKISDTSVELKTQEDLLSKLNKRNASELDTIAKKRQKIKDEGIFDPVTNEDLSVGALRFLEAREKSLNEELSAQQVIVNKLKGTLGEYKVALNEATKETTKFFKENDTNTGKPKKIDFKFDLKMTDDYEQLIEFNALGKSLDRLKQYADVVLDVNASEKERSAALRKLGQDSLSVNGINKDLFNSFKIGKTPIAEISKAIDDYGFQLQNLIVLQDALKNTEAPVISFDSNFKSDDSKILKPSDVADRFFSKEDFARIKDIAKDLPKIFLDSFSEFDGAFPSIEAFKKKISELVELDFLQTGVFDFGRIQEIIDAEFAKLKANVDTELNLNVDFDQLAKGTALIEKQVQRIKDNIISAFSGLQNILQETFFNTLEEGAVNWKEFADSVIKEVKRIAAALLAKALVTALANILAPGTGSAVSAALKGIDSESLGKYLTEMDEIGIPGAANYGGIRGADMAMSGSVVMSIRGTDLVGVMNRTNVSINRVG